jgi:thiol-disulfide isomerase/thioredoxin
VVFIFRTTCPFCRATLPIWQQVSDSLRRVPSPPIELLAISLDSLEPTRAYVRANGLPYPALLFPERKLARLYRAAAVPLTLVLNGEGRVLYARTGLLDSAAVLDSVYRAATARRARDMLPLPARRTAARRP